MKTLKVSVIVDSPGSWMVPYARSFVAELRAGGHDAAFFTSHEDVPEGDIAVFLSCEKIISRKTRERNICNLVVHESDLPGGRGWSPVTWQVLEGKNRIPVCLFEAADAVDAGPLYLKGYMELEGHELVEGIRKKQAEETFGLIRKFLEVYPGIKPKPQEGEGSAYRKRTPADSRLDPKKSIAEQFNLLRVVDNDRYPAFFEYRGCKYVLKIQKEGNADG